MLIMKIVNEFNLKKMRTYRWVGYGCLAATYFLVFFHRLSLGTLKIALTESFGLTSTAFASLGSMYFYAYLIMQIPTGILADTVGARITVAIGSLVTACGAAVFALSRTLPLVFLGRFLIGLGVSVAYVCMLKVITQWFPEEKFGTMVGLTGFIGNLGGIVAQTPLAMIIAVLSWRLSMAAVAFASLILAVMCTAVVRNNPQEMGFPPVNGWDNSGFHSGSQKTSIKEGLLDVLKNRRTWLIFIILACYSGAYLAFAGTWGVSYFREVYQIDNVKASEYMSMLVLGISLGYLIIGFVSDHLKSRKIPLIVLGFVLNLLWFILLFYDGGHLPANLLGVVVVLMGFCTICYSLTFSLGKEVNAPRYSGMAVSVVNLGCFLAAAVVPILIGIYFDKYQGVLSGIYLYRKGFSICLILNAVALEASFFVKETHCRNIWSTE
jgi:sugar phosphate permease